MLAEFALTPEIFDEQAHADHDVWWEQLRELGSGMFPRSGPSAMVVSDLFDGSWRHVAAGMADSITDDRARRLCQGLLQKLADCLVHRPASPNAVWPEGELAWANEAIASYTLEPLDRIITSATTCAALAGKCGAVRSLTEVAGGGFWRGPWEDTSPPMRIAAQIDALRKICVHAEFVCLISPHVYGGGDDETDFVVELIRSCYRRPSGFRPVEIEIHTETFEPNSVNPDFATKLASRIANVSQAIRGCLSTGQAARLILWPKLVDRLLIAGTYTDSPRQRRPRWGIGMSHIARKPDEKRADFFTEWKLLPQASLGRWFDEYCKNASARCLRELSILP